MGRAFTLLLGGEGEAYGTAFLTFRIAIIAVRDLALTPRTPVVFAFKASAVRVF